MRRRRSFGIVVSAAALLIATSGVAHAADPKVEVDEADQPLVISDFIGDDADFSGALRLHALEDVDSIRALFSDLTLTGDPTTRIKRSQMSLSDVPAMKKDDFVDAKVTVASVETPGEYKGTLELIPAGNARGDVHEIAIELQALAHPVLTPLPPQDRVHGAFAHCGLSCKSTSWLVPGSAGAKAQSVLFSVSDRQTATVTGLQVTGVGEDSAHELTDADLGLDSKHPDAKFDQNGDVLSLAIRINPETLPADHYTGTVRLTVEHVDAPVTVPVDFTVRNEPLGAILALLVGVLLGRLSSFMQGRGGELLNEYKRAALLEGRIAGIADDATRTTLLNALAVARERLAARDLDAAKKRLDEIDQQTATTTQVAAVGPASTGQRNPVAHWIARWISPVRTELGLAAHVLGLALLIGVVIVGFETLYFNQGTSFGSDGIFDLVGLVLWGVSTDVASRGLGNLAGTGEATQ